LKHAVELDTLDIVDRLKTSRTRQQPWRQAYLASKARRTHREGFRTLPWRDRH